MSIYINILCKSEKIYSLHWGLYYYSILHYRYICLSVHFLKLERINGFQKQLSCAKFEFTGSLFDCNLHMLVFKFSKGGRLPLQSEKKLFKTIV